MLPLLFSPIAAAILGFITYRLLLLRSPTTDCACVVGAEPALAPVSGPAQLQGGAARLIIAEDVACDKMPRVAARFSIAHLFDRLHIVSAALICFARGVNDTPKLAALLIAAHLLDARLSIVLITGAMASGGLLFAKRVAVTMSQRVTRLEHTQGVAANLITAALVLSASKFGLPVSTTHVSVGSIAGVGAGAHSLNWNTLRNILLSWVATLPMAAGFAWIALKII